jgi:hypothetical protein
MKKASSPTKRDAKQRKDATKLRALATGLRLMTTDAPKESIRIVSIQKRMGDMS